MKPGDFPTQDRCDVRKRDEAFAWMLVAPPFIKGAALPMNSEYLQELSGRIWDCGARVPHTKGIPKFQKIEWFPPGSQDPHWLTSPGLWLPKGTKRPEIDKQINMVSVMEAMRKADEGDFLAAVDAVAKKGKK